MNTSGQVLRCCATVTLAHLIATQNLRINCVNFYNALICCVINESNKRVKLTALIFFKSEILSPRAQ